MKLLIISDLHIDAVTLGVERRPELLEYLQRVTAAAWDEKVDVVVFAGDAHDPGLMLAPQYTYDLIQWFGELARISRKRCLIGIAGNHDVVEVSWPLTTLTPVAAALGDVTFIAETPDAISIDSEGVTFLLLPYIARAVLECGSILRGSRTPQEALDAAFLTAHRARRRGDRVVVVGHRTVPGALVGSESIEMSRGRDYDLPLDELRALEPALVINGHYHRPQVVPGPGFDIVIPGSPLSFTTDDPASGKGYVIAEV